MGVIRIDIDLITFIYMIIKIGLKQCNASFFAVLKI